MRGVWEETRVAQGGEEGAGTWTGTARGGGRLFPTEGTRGGLYRGAPFPRRAGSQGGSRGESHGPEGGTGGAPSVPWGGFGVTARVGGDSGGLRGVPGGSGGDPGGSQCGQGAPTPPSPSPALPVPAPRARPRRFIHKSARRALVNGAVPTTPLPQRPPCAPRSPRPRSPPSLRPKQRGRGTALPPCPGTSDAEQRHCGGAGPGGAGGAGGAGGPGRARL